MIAKQPNGLYCRISTIVDAPTHTNMSKEEVEKHLRETKQLIGNIRVETWLKSYEVSFDYAVELITTLNMTKKEIDDWIKLVNVEVVNNE